MQFDYGIDDTNSDGSPDTYKTAADADWKNVMAVRVHLLARNNEPTAGNDDSKTYNLGLGAASTVVPAGTLRLFKRHAYSQLVRVINPSGRREMP